MPADFDAALPAVFVCFSDGLDLEAGFSEDLDLEAGLSEAFDAGFLDVAASFKPTLADLAARVSGDEPAPSAARFWPAILLSMRVLCSGGGCVGWQEEIGPSFVVTTH